jgi:hypothetical protein
VNGASLRSSAGCAVLFAGVAQLLGQAPEQARTRAIVVSQNRGDDAAAGTAAAPVRTVTRGIALAGATGAAIVRVEYGEYGPGEVLPIELPPGIEVAGIGAGGSSLACGGKVAFRVAPAPRVVASNPAPAAVTVLAGFGIHDAAIGVALPASDTAGTVLVVRGTTFRSCAIAVSAPTGKAALELTATGMRTEQCAIGIDVSGTGPCRLRLDDSTFTGGDVGVLLRAAEGVEVGTYDGPGGDHDVALLRCSFLGCARAGLARRGAAGTNRGSIYTLADCSFAGNGTGIDLPRPAGDTPLVVTGTRFHGNSGFGVRTAGQNGDPLRTSTFTGCDFRWNGVGLHATNCHVACSVRRCTFVDNLGNALFLANFMAAPVSAAVADCLIAGNGGAGVYTLADGERLAISLHHCTITANGSSGVHRQTKHNGRSTLSLVGCIVAGNAIDLERVRADEVATSLIGDGTGGDTSGNLAGDPGFVDARRRDYRLRAESRCIDSGSAAAPGALDLAGNPRLGRADLGALEHAQR